jgi:hypothetical protein
MPETTSNLLNQETRNSVSHKLTSYDRGNADFNPTPYPILDRGYSAVDQLGSPNETGVPQPKPILTGTSSWTPETLTPEPSGIQSPPPAVKVKVSRRWEGSVLEVDEGFFEAKLTPISDGGPDVIADISVADIAADDMPLLRPGAPLHVTAGHVRLPGGRVIHTSTVQLRRLGRWRSEEIALLEERAQKRRAALGFDDNSER